MNILIPAGSALLLLSLAAAWLLVGVRHLRVPALRRAFPGDADLLRCHLDYLLMALLLYAFAALRAPLPPWITACLIAGAFTNPALFLATAIRPQLRRDTPPPFQVLTALSFLATTLGAAGAAIATAIAACAAPAI